MVQLVAHLMALFSPSEPSCLECKTPTPGYPRDPGDIQGLRGVRPLPSTLSTTKTCSALLG